MYVKVQEHGTLFQLVGMNRYRITGEAAEFTEKLAKELKVPVKVLPLKHRVWRLFPERA